MDTEYENLHEAIAETVSSDSEAACEFLEDEGKNPEEIIKRGMELIELLQDEAIRNKNLFEPF